MCPVTTACSIAPVSQVTVSFSPWQALPPAVPGTALPSAVPRCTPRHTRFSLAFGLCPVHRPPSARKAALHCLLSAAHSSWRSESQFSCSRKPFFPLPPHWPYRLTGLPCTFPTSKASLCQSIYPSELLLPLPFPLLSKLSPC